MQPSEKKLQGKYLGLKNKANEQLRNKIILRGTSRLMQVIQERVVSVVKLLSIRCAEKVVRKFIGETRWKSPLGRLRKRWKCNINMDPKEIDRVNLDIAADHVQRRAL